MHRFFFLLNNQKNIHLTVPDLAEKVTYFYEPTETLHRFDEATAVFTNQHWCTLLKQDALDEIICRFRVDLKNALENKLILQENMQVGRVGYELNYELHALTNESISLEHKPDRAARFWTWCGPIYVHMLIYNHADKIFLEIAPFYPWVFNAPEPSGHYVTFEQFMQQYKPLAVEELSHTTATEWVSQCEEILRMIGIEE